MARIKRQTTNFGKDMGKLEPSYIAGRKYKIVQSLWETILQYLKKLNAELPYEPAIPLLGIYLGEIKTYVYTKTVYRCHSIVIHNGQKVERTKCPSTNECINKFTFT